MVSLPTLSKNEMICKQHVSDIEYMRFIMVMYDCYNINNLHFKNGDPYDFTTDNVYKVRV